MRPYIIDGRSMLILLSPAKTQNFSDDYPEVGHTLPQLTQPTAQLIKKLKTLSSADLKNQLSVSDKLAELNHQRFINFNPNSFTLKNSKPAIYVFEGDAYRALSIHTLTTKNINYLQKNLVILSGLYGCLKPLDLIQAYRLEMKTKLPVAQHKNLYGFWENILTKKINQMTEDAGGNTIINLASSEYSNAIDMKSLNKPMITIDFKESHNGGYRTIGIHAKRARGMMVRFMAEHNISNIEQINDFQEGGYRLSKKLTQKDRLCFVR